MTSRYMIVGDNGVIKVLQCEAPDAELEAESRHASTGIVQRVMDEAGNLIYTSVGPTDRIS